MGRRKKLIVEPRLDGLAVISDQRNRREWWGKTFPYDHVRITERVVLLLEDSPHFQSVRLKPAWMEQCAIAKRAAKRRLQQTLRAGTLDTTITLKGIQGVKWFIGTILAGLILALAYGLVSPWLGWHPLLHPLPPGSTWVDRLIASGVWLVMWAAPFALYLVAARSFWRQNAVSLRLRSDGISTGMTDGTTIEAPWTDVASRKSVGFGLTVIRLRDGREIRFVNGRAGQMLQMVVEEARPDLRDAEKQSLRATLKRSFVWWTCGCLLLMFCLLLLRGQIVNPSGIPGIAGAILWPLALWLFLPAMMAAEMLGRPWLERWQNNRGNRRRRAGRRVMRRDAVASGRIRAEAGT